MGPLDHHVYLPKPQMITRGKGSLGHRPVSDKRAVGGAQIPNFQKAKSKLNFAMPLRKRWVCDDNVVFR